MSNLDREREGNSGELGMIEVVNLSKRFLLPGGDEVLAVNGIRFSVAPGEVYGLLGPNGAGKTTTLRMILGLLKSTEGWATIAGMRSSDHPDEVRRRVGFISANAGVYQQLTAREMLLYFADLYAVPPADASRELDRLADLFSIQPLLDRPCSTLSTGQRQRVSLARALIHRPTVMLLDEPTLGLDVIGSQIVIEFIEHLRIEKKAVILSTHHLDEAERICNRFGLLHEGRIVAEGSLDQLRERTGRRSLVDMFLHLAEVKPTLKREVVTAS